MDGFKNSGRPKKSQNSLPQVDRSLSPSSSPTSRSVEPEGASTSLDKAPATMQLEKKKSRNKLWIIVATVLVFCVGALVMAVIWYFSALEPVSDNTDRIKFTIDSESVPSASGIASDLKGSSLIRSELAFLIYVRQAGVAQNLQAGTFYLSQSDSVSEIVEQLMDGKSDSFEITFYPGAVLFDPTDTPDKKRTDVYTMLRRAGYSDEEVKQGLAKEYDHPLLAGKPDSANLEGYIYGETYLFDRRATVEEIIIHTFDVFYGRIEEAGILDKLVDVDMTLYEAITLASVIEREVSGQLEDQRIVSQIFHRRLKIGEPLGADATFVYVAQQRNEVPSINIDSPYNTRVNKGLPPGPIASPHIKSLEATVDPADTDYLFFVSGDDGTNHFAHTNAEHEENVRRYCTIECFGR